MLNGWTTNVAKTKNLRMMNKIIFGVEKIDKCSGTAYALGYGGAVPFVVFVAMQWHGYQLIQGEVSLIYFYGSIILSFLGAPHWGYTLAMADKAKIKNLSGRLVIGVIPSLIAFFSILFDEVMTDAVERSIAGDRYVTSELKSILYSSELSILLVT